jgi:hypothetical protein
MVNMLETKKNNPHKMAIRCCVVIALFVHQSPVFLSTPRTSIVYIWPEVNVSSLTNGPAR